MRQCHMLLEHSIHITSIPISSYEFDINQIYNYICGPLIFLVVYMKSNPSF